MPAMKCLHCDCRWYSIGARGYCMDCGSDQIEIDTDTDPVDDEPSEAKAEVEIETAQNILAGMERAMTELSRWWPESKRGSNARRVWSEIEKKREAIADCLRDARTAFRELSN